MAVIVGLSLFERESTRPYKATMCPSKNAVDLDLELMFGKSKSKDRLKKGEDNGNFEAPRYTI